MARRLNYTGRKKIARHDVSVRVHVNGQGLVFDADLARQMRRAMASITLNIAEGSYARGRNRHALYQVALGSAKETRACLDVARSFGYVEVVDDNVAAKLGSICAVLYSIVT